MMLCTRCKKRPAVIFMTRMDSGETINEGLCIICARELGIKQVDEIVKKMGMTYEDIENMNEQLMEAGDSLKDDENKDEFDNEPAKRSFFGLTGNIGRQQEKNGKDKTSHNKKEPSKRKFLDSYCVNLNKKAKEGKVDNVIGREKEEQRIIQILNRRTKNNVCLIGEPGVGKTAIVEEIAQKIVDKNVPFGLLNKEIYLLDLTALVAGTRFRGQFESRIKSLVDEVKAAGNIILFIDEVHNLVGTGDAEGTMNAANILKPALSRGEIQVIGATTFGEYRKHIEKDSALERRFQPIKIDEPSVKQTIDIINGIKKYYEIYHNVQIPDSIVTNIVELSERYITDRFLPDKAIDLLDEACSSVALNNADLEKYKKIKAEYEDVLEAERKLKENEDSGVEIDYEQMAKLKAEHLQCEESLKKQEKLIENISVTKDTLASVIELWTGVPAAKIKETELSKIRELKTSLKKEIIGQDEAIDALCAAVVRAKVKIVPKEKPVSLIFVGSTGVGKTQLARSLAHELFSEATEPLIKLDMSEFMEKHTVSRMIGAPPGYVGYDEAGQLTEKVRRQPYSVILLDEIEKAHPDVMNILLQILDDGMITDSQGRKVSFIHTIIIMTSNAGSNINANALGFDKEQNTFVKEKAKKALADFLRPEFLARVDEIIAFNQLTSEDYLKITVNKLEELKKQLQEQSIALNLNENVAQFIQRQAYKDVKTGVRGIMKIIRKEIEDNICDYIVNNHQKPLVSVTVGVKEDALVLEYN